MSVVITNRNCTMGLFTTIESGTWTLEGVAESGAGDLPREGGEGRPVEFRIVDLEDAVVEAGLEIHPVLESGSGRFPDAPVRSA